MKTGDLVIHKLDNRQMIVAYTDNFDITVRYIDDNGVYHVMTVNMAELEALEATDALP